MGKRRVESSLREKEILNSKYGSRLKTVRDKPRKDYEDLMPGATRRVSIASLDRIGPPSGSHCISYPLQSECRSRIHGSGIMKHNLKFPEVPTSSFQTSPKAKTATYSLLELPSELLSIVDREQESSSTIPPLFIKGDPTSDAVLCTYSKTYSLRAVKNSNSLLLVQLSNEDGDPPGKGGDLEVLQILGRTLEVSLVLPRWEKLEGLLRNSIFDGLENEEDEGKDSRKVS